MFLYRLLGVSFPGVQLSVFQNLHFLTEKLFCPVLFSVICSAIYVGLFEFIDHFRNHPLSCYHSGMFRVGRGAGESYTWGSHGTLCSRVLVLLC